MSAWNGYGACFDDYFELYDSVGPFMSVPLIIQVHLCILAINLVN